MAIFNYLAVALFLLQTSTAQLQRAVLYEGLNSAGAYIVIPQTYSPNLGEADFNDRAESTCVTGVWLFYDAENYNTGTDAGMEYAYGGSNYCANFVSLRRQVTSVRFAGSPTNYAADTLTLYEGTYFQGSEEYLLIDTPNLSLFDNHKSLIITGSSEWTLYDRPSFTGIAICVGPRPNGDPNLIYNIEDIDIPHGAIQSVRKGCFGRYPQKTVSNIDEVGSNIAEFARGGHGSSNRTST